MYRLSENWREDDQEKVIRALSAFLQTGHGAEEKGTAVTRLSAILQKGVKEGKPYALHCAGLAVKGGFFKSRKLGDTLLSEAESLGYREEELPGMVESGEEPDYEPLEYWEEALKEGWYRAVYEIGMLYLWGLGVPQSDEEAVSRFEESIWKDQFREAPALSVLDNPSRFMLELLQEYNEKFADKNVWLSIALSEQDPGGRYELGIRYILGKGVIPNIIKAKDLLQKGAKASSHPGAMRVLAGLYLYGFKTGQRAYSISAASRRAQEWYGKAAALGDVKAMYNAGILYEFTAEAKGNIEENLLKAISWYGKAEGSPFAAKRKEAAIEELETYRKTGIMKYLDLTNV